MITNSVHYVFKHESYDKFAIKMKWHQIIRNSTKNDIKVWIQNMDDDMFHIYQKIFLSGFDTFMWKNGNDLHPKINGMIDLHPMVVGHHKKNDNGNDNGNEHNEETKYGNEDNDTNNTNNTNNTDNDTNNDTNNDTDEVLNDDTDIKMNGHHQNNINLFSIHKDLLIYLCQFLEIIDLVRMEKTSHFGLQIARNPSSLYALNICGIDNRLKIKYNECGYNYSYFYASARVFGKFRFANLRKLILAINLQNIQWTQLYKLIIRGDILCNPNDTLTNTTVSLPIQTKLQYLQCTYTTFLSIFTFIQSPTFESLKLLIINDLVHIRPINQYFPSLKYLTIEGHDYVNWQIIMMIIKSIHFVSLYELNITVPESMEIDTNIIKNDIEYLLKYAQKIDIFIPTNDIMIVSKIISLSFNNDSICTNLKVFVCMILFTFTFSLNDMKELGSCMLWNHSLWPDTTKIHFGNHITFELGFTFIIKFPFGNDPKHFLVQIKDYLVKKYERTVHGLFCVVKFDEVLIAIKEEEMNEYDCHVMIKKIKK